MLARPSVFVTVATGSTAIGRERVEARRYEDAHLIDRMHHCSQLSDRQHEAAQKLLEMWVAAGLTSRGVAAYGEPVASGRPVLDDDDQPTAADRYRRFMRRQPEHFARLFESTLLGQHPGIRWLATLQAGLDRLADEWMMETDQ
jgi:hypothetical protein